MFPISGQIKARARRRDKFRLVDNYDRTEQEARWQEPLAAAVLEFNPRDLFVKVQTAEEAMANRFEELAFEKESRNEEELRLLSDGLPIIRGLKKDRLSSLATKNEPLKYHIYRCDKSNGYQWIASAETVEQAMAEVVREHAKSPYSEYRVINPALALPERSLKRRDKKPFI